MTIKFQRLIDRYLGNVACLILGLFTPKPTLPRIPKRIAIVKIWAIGESILVLPLIHQLKQHYPHATIDVITHSRNAAVFTGNADIKRVILLNKDKIIWRRTYDLVFDCEPYLNLSALITFFLGRQTVGFSHGLRSRLYTHKIDYNDQQHVVLTYLDLLRPFFTPGIPKRLIPLAFTQTDERRVIQFLSNYEITKNDVVIGICATAAESAPSRYWPPERFAQLMDRLLEQYDARIVLVGTQGDRAYNEALIAQTHHQNRISNAAGKTSVKELFALIKRCTVFISNDTGPMHIAAAQGVPTIGLFCPNTPARFAPYGPKNIAIYKPVLPTPCINVHLGNVPDCRAHGHMRRIEVKDVVKATETLLTSH